MKKTIVDISLNTFKDLEMNQISVKIGYDSKNLESRREAYEIFNKLRNEIHKTVINDNVEYRIKDNEQ